MGKKSSRKKNKLGRNEPCFCGSGIKYKKCCLPKGLVPPRPISEVPLEVLEKWNEMNEGIKELQAKGIYINLPNTIQRFKDKSYLAVGSKLMWDANPDATFHQLILRNLQLTLAKEWWEAELAKPAKEQHFIMQCYGKMSSMTISEEQDLQQVTENLRTFLPTGYMQSLMSLAFDVYLLQHKNSFPDDWLRRLRTREQYQGVRYEIAVASIFARIGCTLEFYDDKGNKTKHPEFIATHEETGNKVAVEVKSRHRQGVIHTTGEANLRKAMLGDITKLFNAALKKQTDGLPYMIFIDVNAPTESDKTAETRWFADVKKMMIARGEVTPENPEPQNLLCVTNYSPHYEGDKVTKTGGTCFVAGLHTVHPLADGVEGVFMAKIMQAANGYGFVPNL